MPNDEIFSNDKAVPVCVLSQSEAMQAISDYHRAPLTFQLRRPHARVRRPERLLRFVAALPGGDRELPAGLSRFQTESAIQGRGHVNHVNAFEELVPGRWSTKCHSSRRVFPNRNHYAGNVRRHRATLKRLLNAGLLRGRSFSERPIDWNDDYVLPVASQMRHLKGGHCVVSLWTGLSHGYGDFNRRATASMSVFFLEL